MNHNVMTVTNSIWIIYSEEIPICFPVLEHVMASFTFCCLHKFHLEYLKIFLTLNIISYYLIKCSVSQINKWKLCIVSSVHLCCMSYYSLPTEVASGFQLCVFLVAGVCWLILIIFLKNKFKRQGFTWIELHMKVCCCYFTQF